MTIHANYQKYEIFKFDEPSPGVLRLTLNKPERLNALDAKGHREIADIWLDIDKDPNVSAVILRAEGRSFSAGGDFEMVKEMTENFETKARVWREARDLVYNIINCSKPIISSIHGAAVGAGLVAALLADISIATKSAKIVDGHTRLGVAAGDHAAIIWPLLCGMAKAKYYLLLCEPITGQEAERIGLVSLCVEEDELESKSLEIAKRLATGSPTAIRWTKYSLNNWLRQAGPIFDTSLALEMLGFGGPDVIEGLSSHIEKRKPNFNQKSNY